MRALLCLTLLPAGCGVPSEDGAPPQVRSETGRYELEIDEASWVPEVGERTLALRVLGDRGPVEARSVSVEPWMPAHGHGSTTTPVVTDLPDRWLRVEALTYTMPGLWELRIRCEIAGGAERFVLPVHVR